MFDKKSVTVSVGGKEITFETGKIARQAGAAVVVRSGDTMLLNTVCSAPSATETDFLPLRVDYQEKFSSAGKTLGGFIKREGRPTERETLVCRLIDRPIRPMFEDGFYDEVQILSYVLSYDQGHAPEPLAICGASAALVLSDIPFIKPIGAVRMGMIGGEFIINPSFEQQQKSRLDLVLAGTEDAILMIEGYCDFLSEEQIIQAIEEGHVGIRAICQTLSDWQKVIGKPKKRDTLRKLSSELITEMEQTALASCAHALKIKEKAARESALTEILNQVTLHFFPAEIEKHRYSQKDVKAAFKQVKAKAMREMILNEGIRSDGRSCDQIRPIDIEMSLLPRTHGSALFTRGETQIIAVATLGGGAMAQRSEALQGELSSRFYLQYSFPPFSVGEVGRVGAPGRREVGHGKLAERSLAMVVPSQETFPYSIRLECNTTESNGSSSMASVCGGCWALMDAGVPIRWPISGIAMGLILEGDRYAILSDILGVEDALGDMDFKITGGAEGITAFQLDIKVEGITHQIMQAALAQAKQGRMHILNKMLAVCNKPKEHLSSYAPRIETVQIKPSKIGIVIGPGGKQIRAIIEESGAEVDIDDSGLVSISATSVESMRKAKEMIHGLTAEAEVDKIYKGKVKGIVEFGAFIEIFPGKEGLCHISELAHARVQKVTDVVREGDEIEVKVLEVNDRGQIRLSRKALLPRP